MPEQDESTRPAAPALARTLLTYHENQARRTLMQAAGKLSAIRADLWNLHVDLSIPDDEVGAILEGEKPESLAFAIQGAIECVNRDNLDGAIRTLEETALLSPGTLVTEWEEEQQRKRAQTSRGQENSE